MMDESLIEDIKAYFVNEELRLQYQIDFWADELRRFPIPTIASSYGAALASHLAFLEFRSDMEKLLGL